MSKMSTEPLRHALNGPTMGTRWSALFYAPAAIDPAPIRAALAASVDRVDRQMSTWKPDSDLMRVNAAAVGTPVAVPAELMEVLARALEIGRRAGGAFDIGVGDIVTAWGFGAQDADEAAMRAALGRARPLAHEALELDRTSLCVRKLAPITLDMSGIAKGYAVDRMMAVLNDFGLVSALIGLDDPSIIGGDVVDAIRCHLAEFRDDEVVHPNRLGLPLRTQFAAAVPEVADKLLLFGIDRDDRLAGSLKHLHFGIDVLELRVAVRMAGAFARLCIGLQAEAQTLQQSAHQLLASTEAQCGERRGQMALAFAHPQQGSLRIAADRGLHQVIQGFQKPRLCLRRRLAAAALPPNSRAAHHRARTQVGQAAIDRAARNPSRPRDRHDPATPGRTRLAGRKQPSISLIQNWLKRFKTSPDGSEVNHPVRIDAPASASRQFPDSFVAFLAVTRFFSSDSVALAQALSGPPESPPRVRRRRATCPRHCARWDRAVVVISCGS